MKTPKRLPNCPLCLSDQTNVHAKDKHRSYCHCSHCELVFVPGCFHLCADDEKAIYDQHENHPEDEGYQKFLSRLMTPLLAHLRPSAKGLDFGCGPGPTLSLMLKQRGFDMGVFDPFYANHPEALARQYDFITTTEVVEHLSQPAAVFEQLFNMLRPEGVLGIMTKTIPSLDNFSDWHYTRDPTHITFYAQESFRYLAKQYQYQVEFAGSDVILMTRQIDPEKRN